MAQAEFISAEHVKKRGPRRAAGPLGNCTGTPEDVAACEESYTGRYLKRVLK